MRQYLESARDLARGVTKRFYWWIFAFVLNPLDIYETIIQAFLPEEQQIEIPSGGTLFICVLALGFIISVILTYHEVRASHQSLQREVDQSASRQHAINRLSRLRSFAINNLWATHVSGADYLEMWQPLHVRWEFVVEKHLRRHFGTVAADRFRDLGQLPGLQLVAHPQYNQSKNMLAKELQIIEEMLGIPQQTNTKP